MSDRLAPPSPDTQSQPLLAIRNLHLTMSSFDGVAHVLNGIDLTVERGEIWGLVGESGCGKSLTGLSVSRLVPTPPAAYPRGEIRFEGVDVLQMPGKAVQQLRGQRIGMIFQDPTTNLNPAYRIGEQIADVALAAARHDPSVLDGGAGSAMESGTKSGSGSHSGSGLFRRRRAARRLAADMLTRVGIPDAERRLDNYPHEFSGGMRQRVLIAMALVGRPDLLIADEPTTALDVSVQAQILRLLKERVADQAIGIILITHNLGVVAETCSHVAVMYAGNIVERGPVAAVIERPAHPYTQALIAAIPTRDSVRGSLLGLGGAVPNLVNAPPGCRFAPRCALAVAACRDALPAPVRVGEGHEAACIRIAPTAPTTSVADSEAAADD